MWVYKGKEINSHDDLLPECTHFVYVISYKNNKFYIGQKSVITNMKKPPLKGKKRNRRVLKKVSFIDYIGSHDSAKDFEIEKKEILYQCSSKKAATYIESALLFEHDAIFSSKFLNKNISGVHFNNSLDGLLE